jgi:hypothetical protein
MYDGPMARGWESKSVEAQQDEKARTAPAPRSWSLEQAQRADRRRTLEMTRARIVNDLGLATAEPHRRMLDDALVAIDQQLAAIDREV